MTRSERNPGAGDSLSAALGAREASGPGDLPWAEHAGTVQVLLEGVPFPAVVIGDDFVVLGGNEHARRAGTSIPEGIVGQKCYRVFHGTDEPTAGCPFSAAKLGSEPREGEVYEASMGIWVSAQIYPTAFRTDDGRRAYLHFSRDITAQKDAEQALRDSEELFRSITTSAGDAVFLVNGDGLVELWNRSAEELFGYSADEAIGRPLHEFLVPERLRSSYLAALRTSQQPADRSGERRNFSVIGVRKDGVELPIEVSYASLHLRSGWHRLTVARDVSDVRHLQARLGAAEQLATVGLLAASVAHEIRNPLACADLNLQFLAEGLGDDAGELREAIHDAREGLDRITSIAADLRDLSRMGVDGIAEADLNGAIETAVRMTRRQTARRTRVVCDLGDVPLVKASQARLGQIFINLLANAAHATEGTDGAEIRVRSWRESDEVLAEVVDNGPGIPAEELSRVFDLFYTTKGPAHGTGLGLWICRDILAPVGGTIEAESGDEGGARFVVRLQLAEE